MQTNLTLMHMPSEVGILICDIYLAIACELAVAAGGVCTYTGGSHLSWIFWEHGSLSGLSVIWLNSTDLH